MQTLYIITGPTGVGKSTISKELSIRSKKSALIEGDEIYHQVVGGYIQAWKEGNHLETFWKVCINTIKIYLNDGFDVVFNYIISPDNIELIRSLIPNYNIKFVVLLTNESTLLARDKERPIDFRMNERCLILLNNFKNRNYNSNNILDTSNLSVDETLNIIKTENRFIL